MNTTSNSTHAATHASTRDIEQDGERDTATRRAEAGTGAWEDAVRLQRWAKSDHTDFYVLAGEIVSTLYALEDLAHMLARQVSRYGQARQVYDDTRQVDPAARLADAATELGGLLGSLRAAQAPANRFWSAIGHIGVDPDTAPPDTAPPDMELPDTAPPDTELPDTELPDTRPPNTSPSDRPSAGGEVSS